MHTENKKAKMRSRYRKLRAVGFNASEANKYKTHNDDSVREAIEIKKIYNYINPNPTPSINVHVWESAYKLYQKGVTAEELWNGIQRFIYLYQEED